MVAGMEAILAEGLTKIYGGDVHRPPALRDVTLSIPRGQIFGLIGRNGAGKTTFLRIAATQLLPTAGRLTVLGHDVVAEATAIREDVAVIPQESRPIYYLTPLEHVYYYLLMRGFPKAEARARAREALDHLGLSDRERQLVRKLSGGLRRRVLVAMALASDAPLMFLDEPTTGLDPLARRDVWQAIKAAAGAKKTVVLTTHYMEEAEILSDRMAILDEGVVKAVGDLQDLVAKVRFPFRVSVQGGGLRPEVLGAYGPTSRAGDRYVVFTDRHGAEELTKRALEKRLRAVAGPVTLEDVFVQLVGKEAEA
jgi:ABC-2 type transport system ATP-binding protein